MIYKVASAQYCYFCKSLLALPILHVRWQSKNITTCFKCFREHKQEFEDNTGVIDELTNNSRVDKGKT